MNTLAIWQVRRREGRESDGRGSVGRRGTDTGIVY